MKLALMGISATTIVLILLEMAGLIGELLPTLFWTILMFTYAIRSYQEKDTKWAVFQGVLGALVLLTLAF